MNEPVVKNCGNCCHLRSRSTYQCDFWGWVNLDVTRECCKKDGLRSMWAPVCETTDFICKVVRPKQETKK